MKNYYITSYCLPLIITYLRVKETKTKNSIFHFNTSFSIITYLRVKETKTLLRHFIPLASRSGSLPISELRRRKPVITNFIEIFKRLDHYLSPS